jgi:O-antigen ligase
MYTSGFIGSDFKILPFEKMTFIEFGPMKRWIANCFSEDTTYKPPKSVLISDTTKESVQNNRTLRWKFAWQIFGNEYDLKNKIFGGGFTFLNWYGYYFLKDKTKSEYPHNPFLNILLYSGIAGLFLYLFLILKVFFIYSKYRNEYSFFLKSFIIVYFYSFFSGSNPFDPAVMGFFILLPFFIQSIHEKSLVQTQILEPSDEKSTHYGSQ